MGTALVANVMGPDGLVVIVVLAIVLLFGGKQLPRLARGLGSASHEFKKGVTEGEDGATASSIDPSPTEPTHPR